MSRCVLEVSLKSFVRSSLEYADVVWGGCFESDSNLSQGSQIEGAWDVTSALKGTNRVPLLNEFSWVDLVLVEKSLSQLYLICVIYVRVSLLTDVVTVSVPRLQNFTGYGTDLVGCCFFFH